MIALQINGKVVELDQPTPLLRYLDSLGVDQGAVAVEHNGVIIERADYANTTFRDGDTVEIVRMVGGGCLSAVAKVALLTPLTPTPPPGGGRALDQVSL